ncbi:MAG: D-aminopeptidase [Paenibacillus sp.]|nr:D-aminopeptidase [Paenibacillus sp.]
MKIYVSVDMEGIAGIISQTQIFKHEQHYEESRRLLTNEVNAVVEGLLQAGAEEIIVKDAHSTGFNFLLGDLHPDAMYCLGGTSIAQRFPGLDSSFDGAILIGYHSMAGTHKAILDHTFSIKKFTQINLNGQPIGEIGIDSLLFGLLDVPVLLVTGDDTTCAEAERELGPFIQTYTTKFATGRHSGLLKSPRKVNEEIKAAIKAALDNKDQCKAYKKKGPYEVVVHYLSTDLADACYCDGVETVRLDGLRILFKDAEIVSLLNRAL